MQTKVVHDTAPAFSDHTLTVGVIHHEHQIVFAGDLINPVERGKVSIHAEDAIGDDNRPPVGARVGEDHPLQIGRVSMRVSFDPAAGEPAAVNDTGMVELDPKRSRPPCPPGQEWWLYWQQNRIGK